MMRALLILLLLTGCTYTPKLEVGSCYSVYLYATYDPDDHGGGAHELSQFKVHKIFDFEGRKHYAIQVIRDEWTNGESDLVPLYPKAKSYGYAAVREFDRYIGVNAGKFAPATKKTVECNPITDKDLEEGKNSPRMPLQRVGNDLDGTRK